MKDTASWRWPKSILCNITEKGVSVFDWLGNSADLIPIEEVYNIIKKKSRKFPNNKKKALE